MSKRADAEKMLNELLQTYESRHGGTWYLWEFRDKFKEVVGALEKGLELSQEVETR